MSTSDRKPVNIRFRYNKVSGEIEDLIVDDNSPAAAESYHDRIADLVARQLGSQPVIYDIDSPPPSPIAQTEPTPETHRQRDVEQE